MTYTAGAGDALILVSVTLIMVYPASAAGRMTNGSFVILHRLQPGSALNTRIIHCNPLQEVWLCRPILQPVTIIINVVASFSCFLVIITMEADLLHTGHQCTTTRTRR